MTLQNAPNSSALIEPAEFLDEWETRIRDFERAWLAGSRPNLSEFLPADPIARRAILPHLIHAELEFRIKQKEPARVEEYLQRFPELLHNDAVVMQFLQAEFQLRRRFEPLLSLDDYERRFPQWRESLRTWLLSSEHDPLRTHILVQPSHIRDSDSGEAERATLPEIGTSDWTDFEIREELGRGGMGVVHLAWQRSLERLVAIKTLHPFIVRSEDILQRFRKEAVAAAQLYHPHIVQVMAYGEVAGTPFYVMEYVTGGNLAQRLNGKPWSATASAQLIEALARAVHAAHQQRMLHRDLKPSNILLTDDGVPKISDFGLAKQLDQSLDQTSLGTMLGTPSYMSPEQAHGASTELTAATDVYSLGAILYELLTGQPPFAGGASLQILDRVRTEEPLTPRRISESVPAELEIICLQCLRKDPSRRYSSARALAEDLQRFLQGQPIHAKRYRTWDRIQSWCRRQPALAATSLSLALAIISTGGMLVGTLASQRQAQRRLEEVRTVFCESHVALHSLLDDTASPVEIRRICHHYEAFLAEHDQDAELLPERAIAHLGLGSGLKLLGDHMTGFEHWMISSQMFYDVLPSVDHGNLRMVYWFSILQSKIASWHREQNQLDDAWMTLEKARRVVEAMIERHPHDQALQYCLAWCYSRYGLLGRKAYRAEEALAFCEQARRIWQELDETHAPSPIEENQRTHLPRARLAWTLKYIGLTLQALERHEASWDRFQELRTLSETSLRAPPTNVGKLESFLATWRELSMDARHGLARGSYMIGKRLLNESRPDLAVSKFKESIEHWTEVVNSGQATSSQRSYLASSHFHLAIAHRRQGHGPEALAEYQRACVLWEPMLKDQNLDGFNRELAESHANESRTEIQKIQGQLSHAH